MPEYETFAGRDEARRIHALDEALRSFPLEVGTDEILARAKAFEGYLSGEVQQVISVTTPAPEPLLSMQTPGVREPKAAPSPRPNPPTLPRPQHNFKVDMDHPDCLACGWRKLRDEIKKAGGEIGKPDIDPLPKPIHNSPTRETGGKCWACEWDSLAAKIDKAKRDAQG